MEDPSPPPAALAAFLGEAPSEAALRRPGSSHGGLSRPCSSYGEPAAHIEVASTPASARRPASKGSAPHRSEDSSPDEPDRPPRHDGGFDNVREYDGGPVPSAEALPASSSKAASRRAQQPQDGSGYSGEASGRVSAKEQRPPRAPGSSGGNGYDAGMASPASSTASHPRGSSTGRSARASSPKADILNLTTTPAPSSYAGLMGEEAFDEQPRSSSGHSHRSGSGRPASASRRAGSSGGRDRDKGAEGTEPTNLASAAAALDPLGASGRRRFGGRG
eukprot:TRINITY_DN59169_c0_g1_i1.p1 TRINITY_DN59169_c0_g1~~TRINITY_DN59169_c0_g1_i1.p1  ORF type:complete len:276 (+),score=67.61 TRINITY_DN59169_c0_g1_i1:53-880(+)